MLLQRSELRQHPFQLYERRWLVDVGGWDERFKDPWGPDDIDLLARLQAAGHNHLLAPEIQVVHQWHPHVSYQVSGPENWAYLQEKNKDLFEQPSGVA